jgi:hypothetical protein
MEDSSLSASENSLTAPIETDEVRVLALKLAPTLEQADELLQQFTHETFKDSDSREDYDDLENELEDLEWSEQLLRQELEMAQSMALLSIQTGTPVNYTTGLNHNRYTSTATPRQLKYEADVETETFQEEEALDKMLEPIPERPTVSSPGGASLSSATERRTPFASDNKLIAEVDEVLDASLVTPSTKQAYNQSDHYKFLQLSQWDGFHVVDVSKCLEPHKDVSDIFDYCLSVPEERLKRVYIGLPENVVLEKLPVRTLSIRIRPDVLCGAVMDAAHKSLQQLQACIEKRQGGHLSALVPGAVYIPMNEYVEDNMTEPVEYPPFLVDMNLCTYKSDDCQRVLLVRIYHVKSGQPNSPGERSSVPPAIPMNDALNDTASRKLLESCALLQRVRSPDVAVKVRPKQGEQWAEPASVQQAVSDFLAESYRACPSVQAGHVTFPSLNSQDYPLIESSWRLLVGLWEELETRDLSYCTLATARFGAFPSLPTLDVHYCSQLRRLSRERMLVQLLKRASDLEEYAREAEYKCANLISLMQATFELYSVAPPGLPKPVPLTAYPLRFLAHQATCPPWGIRVMESLNEVQAWTSDAGLNEPVLAPGSMAEIDSKKSLDMAQQAVKLVYLSFQKQDDEEQSARLDRKNVQVMDRLSKMQAHQRASVEAIETSIEDSEKASKAAEDFLAKSGFREVPILKWGVVVGSATGTCVVTANHLLFVTQRIPVIGGNKVTLFDIREIEFGIQETSPSLLNPLPTTIIIKSKGKEVFSFRPSSSGSRLKVFLETIKSVAVDDVLECSVASSEMSPSFYSR